MPDKVVDPAEFGCMRALQEPLRHAGGIRVALGDHQEERELPAERQEKDRHDGPLLPLSVPFRETFHIASQIL